MLYGVLGHKSSAVMMSMMAFTSDYKCRSYTEAAHLGGTKDYVLRALRLFVAFRFSSKVNSATEHWYRLEYSLRMYEGSVVLDKGPWKSALPSKVPMNYSRQ
ncbi:hypothetical protein CBL_01943 [Carabus blaptoides fortunei]